MQFITITSINKIDNIVLLYRFSVLNSNVGATCLIKILDGNQNIEIEKTLIKFYTNVKFVKPAASRSDSAEKYLLARGFKGLKQNTCS